VGKGDTVRKADVENNCVVGPLGVARYDANGDSVGADNVDNGETLDVRECAKDCSGEGDSGEFDGGGEMDAVREGALIVPTKVADIRGVTLDSAVETEGEGDTDWEGRGEADSKEEGETNLVKGGDADNEVDGDTDFEERGEDVIKEEGDELTDVRWLRLTNAEKVP